MLRFIKNPRKARLARIGIVFVLVLLVTGATYAFTASNTISGNNDAGAGSGGISGYVVTANSIHYTIDTANAGGPGISQVTFTVDNPAGDVKVQLVGGGTWYDCGAATGGAAPYTVTCNTTVGGETTALAAVNLSVVAVS